MLVGALSAVATGSGTTPNVRGQLMRGPVRPVSRDDEPNQEPARGVGLTFYRGGSPVAHVVTGNTGRFSLSLLPGAYLVRTARKGPFTILIPRTFRVVSGKQATLHLYLDTGIRAPIADSGKSS